MRTNTTARNVTYVAETDAYRAKIHATPGMYKLLFDSLYTQKELAVVRELLCNAWDAHVEAGTTDIPIEIHLPTPLEPWFEIKDFGTGLAPEKIRSVYMDYGNSTKTHTNELIGGFGIGSKAPYAFTDQFTVTTRWQGLAHTFSAFIDADHGPSCVHMGTTPTDEPNGLTVYVPIPDTPGTFAAFHTALRHLYPYLPTPPRITGADTDFEQLPPPQFDLTVTNLPGIRRVTATLAADQYRRRSPLTVVQGIVPYNSGLDPSDWVLPGHRMLSSRVELTVYADIGEFEVAGNREALSLTAEVKAKLRHTFRRCVELLADHMRKQLDAANTWYEWASAGHGLSLTANANGKPWEAITSGFRLDLNRWPKQGQPSLRGIFSLNRAYKNGYHRVTPSYLSPDIFERTAIFAQPKSTHSIHRYLQQFFAPDGPASADKIHTVLVFAGEVADVAKMLRSLGIPTPVKELPYTSPPPRTSRPGRLGKTKYCTDMLYYSGANQTWDVSRSYQTADEILDLLESEPTMRLSLRGSYSVLRHVAAGLNIGALTSKLHHRDQLLWVDLLAGHTRVEKALTEAAADRRGDDLNAFFAWTPAACAALNTYRQLQALFNQDLFTNTGARCFLGRLRGNHPLTRFGQLQKRLQALLHPADDTVWGADVTKLHALRSCLEDQITFDHRHVDALRLAEITGLKQEIEDLWITLQRDYPEFTTWYENAARSYYNTPEPLFATLNRLCAQLENKQ